MTSDTPAVSDEMSDKASDTLLVSDVMATRKPLTVRMSDTGRQAIEEAAAHETGGNLSDMVRKLLLEALTARDARRQP